MQLLRRSLVALFLVSATFGILAVAATNFASSMQTFMAESDFQRPQRERVYAVNTMVVASGPATPVITTFGEVQARSRLDVRASTGGRLTQLAENMVEGAQVEAGMVLAQVDPTDAASALEIARTELAEAEAELRDAERALDLARDELVSAQDQATLRTAALTRQQDLQARGVGTAAAVENAALSEASAIAQVLSRRQSLAQAESRRDLAGTRMERQRISVANAERDLADTQITTALTGVLSEVTIVEGGLVTANERVAEVIDPNDLEVAFRLSTAQYARLIDRRGQIRPVPITLSLDVEGLDLQTTGLLVRVGAAVAAGQTGRQVFAKIDNAAGFRPGDFVTVRVEEPELQNVALLPATALGTNGSLFAVTEDERLEELPASLLRRQGDFVIVSADGIDGRSIVSERTPLLGAGVKVRVLNAPNGDPGGAGRTAQTNADLITLTDERRARLIAFVEGNRRMPAQAKERVLGQLAKPEVPVQVVERIESRMGG